MKNKQIILILTILILYTLITISGFFLYPKFIDKGNNGIYTYVYVDFSEEEKNEIFSNLNIDLKRLNDNGFYLYSESFLTSKSYPKELQIISLRFDNVYCNVEIFLTDSEIERKKDDTDFYILTVLDYNLEYDGKELRLFDEEKNCLFVFLSSQKPESNIFQQFLKSFLNKD